MAATLESRLKRLMVFRVVMVTTLLLSAAYVEAVSETLLPINPLYFLIAATYALTVVYALALRFLGYLEAQAYVQMAFDLLATTGLVYVAGGSGSRGGFILLYPICVLAGSVVLYRAHGLVLAVAAGTFYAATLWAVRRGLVPPQGLAEIPHMPWKQLLFSVFVVWVACVTVALIGSYLASSLHRAGERLDEVAEQVADLQELNQVIVDSIHSGLLTADQGGRILYVNSFGEMILGRDAGPLRGTTVGSLFASPSLDAPALQVRGADVGLARLEVSYTRPGGEPRELGISVSPLATAVAEQGGYLLVFQDLTDVKRLERDVQTNEKLAALGEMAAQLAHEIRNPLGSISGSAQVLMAEANVSPDQERLLTIIRQESKRLSDVLSHFLLSSRVTVPKGPVDLGPVIDEAVTLLRNAPEVGPDRRVEFESDAGPHLCLADRAQITQVFWNVARNGLEAMPEGGVLRVRLEKRGDELTLTVRDEGVGMDREAQRRLFAPFQTGTALGTGIGLAIVYRIVREHRGNINVRSMPLQGTEVEVRLPLIAVPAAAG